MIQLQQLRYFQVVAETENITRAAEKLHISQPSLSIAISNFEKDAGVPLFERNGRNIRLNDYGRALLRRVERSMAEIDEGQREILDMAEIASKNIKVGVEVITIFPIQMRGFFSLYPDTKIDIKRISGTVNLVSQLVRGELDFALSVCPIEEEGVVCEKFLEENLVLVVSKDNPLASRSTIRLADLKDESFIYRLTWDGRETNMIKLLRSLCKDAGFEPKFDSAILENGTPNLMVQLASAGLGITLIPEHLWDESNKSMLEKLYLEDPSCKRSYYISYYKDHYMSERGKQFYKYFVDHMRK